MPNFSKIFFKLLRTVSYLLVLMLFAMVTLSLVLVYYVSPRLEQWREPIQELVQKQTGLAIEFNALELNWDGLNPQLLVKEVTLEESEQPSSSDTLSKTAIDELRLSLQPRLNFWKGRLLSVDVDQAHLPLLIDPEGDVWIGQHRLPMSDVTFSQLSEDGEIEAEEACFIAALNNYLTRDFGQQIQLLKNDKLFVWLNRISVDNLVLTVRDASGLATDDLLIAHEDIASESSHTIFEIVLNFNKANILINEESIKTDVIIQSDAFSLEPVLVDTFIDYSELDKHKQTKVSGYLNLQSSQLKPKQLFANALDVFDIEQVVVEQFDFTAQLNNGYWQTFKSELQLSDFSMQQAHVEKMHLTVEGEVADALAVFVDHGHQYHPIQFEGSLTNGWLHETLNFRHDFALADVNLKGSYTLDDANLPVLSFDEFIVKDPNVELKARGKWHAMATNENGHIQLEGEIQHLVASYLPHFLPKAIDEEALDWLDGAFAEGTLHNGRFFVDGLVDDYPYGQNPESGVNKITADFQNFALNFDHQAEGEKWPILNMEQGTFRFINDEMFIDANRGWMENSANQKSVYYDNLHAIISSLEDEPQLKINANAETTAEKFLVLMKETPLNSLLSYALDTTEASGELRANLALAIPLDDMEASTIEGKIYTQDADFQLNPGFPKATEITAALSFNENYLTINHLTSQFVGGQAEVSGDVAHPGHNLTIKGHFSGEGIYDYYPLKGLRQLKGLTPYELTIDFLEDDGFNAKLKSNLTGLAINYPDLYTKAANVAAPLTAEWQRRPLNKKTYRDRISANYDRGAAQFMAEFRSDDHNDLVFKRGAIAFEEEPVAPDWGLLFHGVIKQVEIEALSHWIDNFGFEEGDDSNQVINGFDVHVQKLLLGGFELPEITLKSSLNNFTTIPLELSGPTVEGSLILKQSTKPFADFDIEADFNYLHWHVDKKETAFFDEINEKLEEDIVNSIENAPWKINHFALKVKDLRFYKYRFANIEAFGEAENNQRWRLDKLAIQDDSGHLFGTAYLLNKNEKLIADLNFNINVLNVDDILGKMSIGDNLVTGQGDLQGNLYIRDLLNFTKDDMELNTLGVLKDGYINNAGTGATRILSLLSLQALGKIPEMKKIFSSQGSNAMNYNYLRFHLGLKGGRFWLSDFRLDSPILALAAEGQGSLGSTGAINLDVVAIPRLDMSGTAVLTGVIVNPAVGVAAFLSQWLLRSPMQDGLTQRFKVGGTLDQIEIDGVPIEMNLENQLILEEPKDRRIIETPENMIDLLSEEIKTPTPIIIEQGSSDEIEKAL